jgi:hypothetical protein
MTPEDARQTYARMLGEAGETVTIRRYHGTGTPRPTYEQGCAARVLSYQPSEIVGPIVQGDRKIILLAEDMETGDVVLPIVTTDKAVVRGKELAIVAIDDNTRRVGPTLCAYELQVRG